jgi:hypothetical protein
VFLHTLNHFDTPTFDLCALGSCRSLNITGYQLCYQPMSRKNSTSRGQAGNNGYIPQRPKGELLAMDAHPAAQTVNTYPSQEHPRTMCCLLATNNETNNQHSITIGGPLPTLHSGQWKVPHQGRFPAFNNSFCSSSTAPTEY